MKIPDEAVEAALAARLSFKNQRGMDNSANLMRHILEAAAPHLMVVHRAPQPPRRGSLGGSLRFRCGAHAKEGNILRLVHGLSSF